MIQFSDFKEKCKGMFTEEDHVLRSAFILEQDYNVIVTDRRRKAATRRIGSSRTQQANY